MEIEQVKEDRESGTDWITEFYDEEGVPALWLVIPSDYKGTICEIDGNRNDLARRIARVPELEAAYIAQAERIAELEAKRLALKALLEGIGYGDVDDIECQCPELNQLLGMEVAQLTKAALATARNDALKEAEIAVSYLEPSDIYGCGIDPIDQTEARNAILALKKGGE